MDLPVKALSEQENKTAAQYQLETQYGAFADPMKHLQLLSKMSAGPAVVSCCLNLRRTAPVVVIQRT